MVFRQCQHLSDVALRLRHVTDVGARTRRVAERRNIDAAVEPMACLVGMLGEMRAHGSQGCVGSDKVGVTEQMQIL